MNSGLNNALLGIPIGQESLEAVTDKAVSAIEGKLPSLVFSCAMSHSLNVAQADKEFNRALLDADLVVADGVGVKLMARVAGVDVGARIAGEEFFGSLMRTLDRRGCGRVFFFGSSEKVLDLISRRFEQDFRNLEICGTLSPPYRPWSADENQRMIDVINEACPDVLWVGMTAPKQEKWVYKNRKELNVPLIGSIGAVFDYFAGTNPSPPQWVRKYGLETFYRLIKEPRRLWRRAIISNAQFVLRVLRKHLLRVGVSR